MAERAAPPADVTRAAVNLARAITIGLRSWGLYPPEHPAIAIAVDRFVTAATEATATGMLPLSVTPHALMINGLLLESSDLAVSECAALLHDRDILQLTFVRPPAEPSVRALLVALSVDRETRRARGGPAAIWAAQGDAAMLIEQIDYQEILEREADGGAVRRDATWSAIVRSIVMGRKTFSPEDQRRLLDISRDAGAIGELATACSEPYRTPDGAPLVSTQAATILAVYRHVARTVAALEPERLTEVLRSLALVTTALDPPTAVELLQHQESPDDSLQIVSAIRETFDEQQVAMLLARALSTSGHPSTRLARILDALVPDQGRRLRVLKLAERFIGERDFGGKQPIDDIRKSLEELFLQYHEQDYVSADYRHSMDRVGGRATELAVAGLPAEMEEWLATLGHENIRRLSGQLLIDLLRNESSADRMSEIARDMAAFVEDLMLAGAFGEGVPVVEALAAAATRSLSPDACQTAIEGLGVSTPFVEAVAGLADQSAAEFAAFEQLVRAIGPSTIDALLGALHGEHADTATARMSEVIVRMGAAAIPRLAARIDDQRWLVQREVAAMLGRIGSPAAVPPLQALLRRTDLRVMQAAVAALTKIDDPAAARALHTMLKAATGPARATVIETLVRLEDPRAAPMLVRILHESDRYGEDHPLVLETLAALAAMRDDRALNAIRDVASSRRWLSWAKTRRLRAAAIHALIRMGTPRSRQTVDDLAKNGDFFLRRLMKSTTSRVM